MFRLPSYSLTPKMQSSICHDSQRDRKGRTGSDVHGSAVRYLILDLSAIQKEEVCKLRTAKQPVGSNAITGI